VRGFGSAGTPPRAVGPRLPHLRLKSFRHWGAAGRDPSGLPTQPPLVHRHGQQSSLRRHRQNHRNPQGLGLPA
jgi:hypothetical protein